jgi:hypothetical protein
VLLSSHIFVYCIWGACFKKNVYSLLTGVDWDTSRCVKERKKGGGWTYTTMLGLTSDYSSTIVEVCVMHISTDMQFLSTVDVCVFRIKLLILGEAPVSHRSWDSIVSIVQWQGYNLDKWGIMVWFVAGGRCCCFPHPYLPQVPKFAMGPTPCRLHNVGKVARAWSWPLIS